MQNLFYLRAVLFSAFFFLTLVFYTQATHYVTETGAGSLDGSSWDNASNSIQAMIDQALAGDKVWVAQGNYHPGIDVNDSYILKDGIDMYGGFVGNETSIDQRDWTANPTVLDGDLGEDDVYGAFAWYSGLNINTANTIELVVAQDFVIPSIFDGFTLQNVDGGHALRIDNADLTVSNCLITHNQSLGDHGTGILCSNGSQPWITHCQINENYGRVTQGVGIGITSNAQVLVEDCEFNLNLGIGSNLIGVGGAGISNYNTAGPLTVRRCSFYLNETKHFTTFGYNADQGGAISNIAPGLEVYDCSFVDNRSFFGGAILNSKTGLIVNCLFDSNRANVLESGGEASYGGYGSALSSSSPTFFTTMVNCTVVNNDALKTALWGNINLDNCIVWGNIGSDPDPEIPLIRDQIDGNVNVHNSCVQYLLATIPGEDPPQPENFPGSFDLTPMFVDSISDFHLMANSPCIDAGDNGLYPAGGSAIDLGGTDRFLDDPATVDSGNGMAPIIDMGVYEYQDSPVIALNLSVFLEGPYNINQSQMNANLKSLPSFPLEEPFTSQGYLHVGGGGEIIAPALLLVEGNAAIVDWLLVELRDANNPTQVLASQSVLVQSDGTVVNTLGQPEIVFSNLASETVLIALKHRNHFGVRLLTPVSTSALITIDFSDPNIALYGVNAMKEITGLRLMIAGDANNDGQINPVDKNDYWRIENGNPYNYINSKADFNMDGVVNPVDKNGYWRINNSKIEQLD